MGVGSIVAGILIAFLIIVVVVVIMAYTSAEQDKQKKIKEAEEYTKRSYASNNYSYTECKWNDQQNKIVCSYALK